METRCAACSEKLDFVKSSNMTTKLTKDNQIIHFCDEHCYQRHRFLKKSKQVTHESR